MQNDEELFSFVTNLVSKDKDNVILEIGSGSGNLREYIVGEYYGIDIEPQARDIKKVDVRKDVFPFSTGCFDQVFMLETLEHLTDFTNCFNEIRRVIKGDGFFVASVPRTLKVEKLVKDFFGRRTCSLEHMVCFTRSTVRNLFRVNGFFVFFCEYFGRDYIVVKAKVKEK